MIAMAPPADAAMKASRKRRSRVRLGKSRNQIAVC
jgi:hypothetical protein